MKFINFLKEDLHLEYSSFNSDLRRLWAHSKLFSIFALSFFFLFGIIPIIQIQLFSDLYQSLIGAEIISVWTSDVSSLYQKQLILFVCTILLGIFIFRSRGVAKRIGVVVTEIAFMCFMYFALLPLSAFFISTMLVMHIFALLHKEKYIKILSFVVIFIISQFLLKNTIKLLIFDSISMTQFIFWFLSLLIISFYMMIRLPQKIKL